MATTTQPKQGGEPKPQTQQQGQTTPAPQQGGTAQPTTKTVIRDWAAI